jgi:hypothetical protein
MTSGRTGGNASLRMAHRRGVFFAGVDEETDGLRFAWGVQIAGGDRPDNSRSKQSAAIRT